MNEEAPPAELETCAGEVTAQTWPGNTETVSCTDIAGKHTLSTSVSKDGSFVKDRVEDEPVALPAATPEQQKAWAAVSQDSWAESTLTYKGKCPVAMKHGHSFVAVESDGKVVDPFQSTDCMIAVLKTVDGVTDPKAGYFRNAHDGLLPFVRYSYPARHSHDTVVVTFTADRHFIDDPAKGQFATRMSGLFTPGEEPDNFGAGRIAKLWKDRCGVSVSILLI